MQVLKQAKHQKAFLLITVLLAVLFAVNIFIKWEMFGQYTNSAQESWLSGVSSIFVQNWLQEGILNLKFGMFRTFDSIEMRNFSDREVYASFLPGCLILPFLVAKAFGFKAGLIYFQVWACIYHFLGSVITSLITYLLAKQLRFSDNKSFSFSLFSGFLYIFGFLTFMQLSFGYYTDTAVYLIYLLFLLTEFVESPKKRLAIKAVLLVIGISYEWFFISITIISFLLELFRERNKANWSLVCFFHLGPLFCTLGVYFYQLSILDKLEHTYLRFMRRTALNSVSDSSFKRSLSYIWLMFCQKHGAIIILSELVATWNIFFSRFLKNNHIYKNLFLLAFLSSFIQVFVAFEHSAVHYFSGIKLLIPMIIFIPFFFYEIIEKLSKTHLNKILGVMFLLVFLGNAYLLNWVIQKWYPEHRIYSQLEKVFKNYSYEDIFFSYNVQILMDIYQKDDIKLDTKRIIKPSDRDEGEPFTHLLTKKQVYHIDTAEDILTMVDNRDLMDKAKVHMIFYDKVCASLVTKLGSRIKQFDDLYMIDISKKDMLSRDFIDKFSCEKRMFSHHYFAFARMKSGELK